MRKALTSLFAAAALAFAVASADAASRGIFVKLKAGETPDAAIAEEVELYGASHALVIGIDNYTGGWDRLGKAVEDAATVADELLNKGFEVTLKTDLTSDQLNRTLKEFFAIKGADPDARLLLWYAGHGQTLNGEGYLVPADAPPATDPSFLVYALPMRDFGSLVRLARSKHVLSIFDSCFSGTIFQARSGAAPTAITRKTTKPVRQFLTSGDAGQQVRDDGSFREYFIRALRGEEKADFNNDGYVTGEELSLFMGQKMTALTNSAQTPRGGKLQDVKFNQGDFVFALPGGAEPQAVQQPPAQAGGGGAQALELAFWNAIKDSTDPAMFEAYLQQFPQGTFAPLARLKLGKKPESQSRVATVVPQRKPSQTPAFGQDLRREAPRIRSAVVDTLTKLLAVADIRLDTSSPVTAAVRGDSVVLSFRDARLFFGSHDALTLGTITLAVTPRGGETYEFEAKVPERFIGHNISGMGQKAVGYIDFRNPRLGGTYSADLGALTALDLRVKEVEVTRLDVKKRAIFRLAEGSLRQEFNEDAQHRWGGPLKLNLTGLQGGADPAREGVEIGELGLTIQLDGIDLRGLKHIYAALDPESQAQFGVVELPVLLASFLQLPDWNGMGIDVVLSNVTARNNGRIELQIDHGAATARIDGPTDFATATAELTAAGLQTKMFNWPAPIWPSQGNARITASRIPLRSLLVGVLGIPKPEKLLNPQAQTEPPVPGMRPEDLFASAKMEVTVVELGLFSGDLAIRGSGSAVIDPFASVGMVGQAQVTTEGLARAVSLVQNKRQRSDVDDFLTVANSFEKVGAVTGDGAASPQGPVRKLSFDIGLHEKEEPTVNGIPIDRFLGEPDEVFVTGTYVVSPDIQSLNLREEPRMDAPVVEKLKPGDRVFAISRIQTESGFWYKLPFNLPRPFIGYAFGEYLDREGG